MFRFSIRDALWLTVVTIGTFGRLWGVAHVPHLSPRMVPRHFVLYPCRSHTVVAISMSGVNMKEQQPDGSEPKALVAIAVALVLLAVLCVVGVVLVGGGAAMLYRLAEQSPVISSPPLPADKPPPAVAPEPPQLAEALSVAKK
jgi:hypothetical protein